MTADPEALGFRSKVHKSLIVDDRLLGVPYLSALANGLLWVITAVTFQRYRLLLVGVILHVVMWLLTKQDIHLIEILGRYLLYRIFYGRQAGMGAEFGDELPWGALVDVDQGVMQTKNNGLLCTYDLVPYDLAGLSEQEQGAVMLRINQVFKGLEDGWGIWAHLKSLPCDEYPEATWSHPSAALLDHEHRLHLSAAPGRWRRVIRLTFWCQAPSITSSLLHQFFFQDAMPFSSRTSQLDRFEADVQRMVGVLSTACVSLRRLSGRELLTYLRSFVALDDDQHDVEVPNVPVDLSYYLASDCGFWPGTRPLIGTEHRQQVLRCLALSKDVPDELWSSMLKALYQEPFKFDLVTRWLPITRTEGQKLTGKKQINWLSKQKGWLAGLHERLTGQATEALSTHMKKQAQDADAAQDEMLSDESGLGHLSLKLLVRSPIFDPHDHEAAAAAYAVAESQQRQLRTLMQTVGCVCRNEDLNSNDAVLACAPGETMKDVRRHTLTSFNYTHLWLWDLPSSGVCWNEYLQGPALCQVKTEGCMPFGYDPYTGDLGDTLTIGPKGSGKSTLGAFMDIAQWLKYRNATGAAQVIAWDVGGSWRCITLFLHGNYFDLGSGEVPIQILHQVDDDPSWIHDWLVARVKEKHILIDSDVESIIGGALRRLRENRGLPRRMTTLQALMADHLRSVDMSSNSKIDANGMSRRDARLDALTKLIKDVKGALKDWTEGGKYGHLVDAPEDRLDFAQVNTFELRSLLKTPDAYPGVLEVIRHRMNQRLDGRPTRLLYGEAHEYFHNEAHVEALRIDIPHWRRDNASANFSTQAMSQLKGSAVTAFLLGSCQARIFMPNAKAMTHEVLQDYLDLELHRDEIREHIVLADPKHEAYSVHPKHRRRISIRLDPLNQCVCGGNSKEAHRLMDALLDQHGAEEFPWRYLEANGFTEQAHALEAAFARARHPAHLDTLLGALAAAD